jgi:hypothetical protein
MATQWKRMSSRSPLLTSHSNNMIPGASKSIDEFW